jgi:hypothetical protein
MGWCSGTQLAEDVFKRIRRYVDLKDLPKVADILYEEFEKHDADCWEDDMPIIKIARKHNGRVRKMLKENE